MTHTVSKRNPFVVGSWVRGDRFFGRRRLVNEILDGERRHIWVVGPRRLGKTSLLKQIELLTLNQDALSHYFSVFWDLQGSQNAAGLKESLLESLDEATDRLAALHVAVDALESEDLFGILRILKRQTRAAGRHLLLLCDEAEELIQVEKNDPQTLPRLRRTLHQGEHVITVLTATKRLAALERSHIPETSPFLHGFVPPIFLTKLEDYEAERLIRQGDFRDQEVTAIMEKTNNHPYLMQLLGKRLFETGDLQQAIEEVAADDMVSHFFAVDFQYLRPQEREIVLYILQNQGIRAPDIEKRLDVQRDRLIGLLYQLVQLGYIKQTDGAYAVANYFFEKWLDREKTRLYSGSDLHQAKVTPATAPLDHEVETATLPGSGQRLGQHEILEKLGSGGMGVVFKARDVHLQRVVALKLLHPHLLDDKNFRQRFLVEARVASALNHPSIATIYQIGEARGLHFISMEFVEGVVLSAWRSGNPGLAEKVDIAVQIAEALAHAHERGVLHRDVKPENIMVSAEGRAKVLDFGLARLAASAEHNLTRTGATLGTLAYMSPEQASHLPVDARTDVFSFGVVLYELFTGQLPFTGNFELSILYAILNEDPTPPRRVNPDLPEDLESIIQRCLQKDRTRRYATMAALATDLRALKSAQQERG